MAVRNLVSIGDISRQWWDELYSCCRDIISRPGDYIDSCKGKIMASLFYEPSTRTNFSFQAAMQRLGGSVFGFSDPSGTSVSKGETLADTVKIASLYSDTVVLRSPLEGAARAATLYSEVPVINAGDGGHLHPTQTLSDLTAIAHKRGKIGGFRIGLCGDLKYGRTVHSLVEALAMFPDISFYLIAPDELRMPQYVLERMNAFGQKFVETRELAESLPELDIIYMTRVQRERFADKMEYERLRDVYVLTKKMLEGARSDLLIMHPLPKSCEIERSVDSDPRAVYFEQARYGMFIRMALLLKFSHMPRIVPDSMGTENFAECINPSCVTGTERYLPALNKTGGVCGYCDEPDGL